MNSKKHWPSMFMKSNSSTSTSNQIPETPNYSAMGLPYPEGASSHNYVLEKPNSPPKPRSRWNPKREQIRILEAIYNSGMVNPGREEIKSIRVQLQKFGEVGEASVYYWFQNRKSKAKRRERQLQAAQRSKSSANTRVLSSTSSTSTTSTSTSVQSKPMTEIHNSPPANTVHDNTSKPMTEFHNSPPDNTVHNGTGDQNHSSRGPVSSFAGHHSDLQTVYNQMGNYNELSNKQAIRAAGEAGGQGISNTGGVQESIINANPLITVFINDNPIQLPMGPINFRAFFGDTVFLFRSSGEPVLLNEWGFTSEGLQHGAHYFMI